MAEEISTHYRSKVESITLIPSDKGRFDVKKDGELIFSKYDKERFPEFEEIQEKLG